MHFPHEQILDAEGLAAQVGSISAIAALPENERSRILERIRSLAGTGQVELRHICEVQVAERVVPNSACFSGGGGIRTPGPG